MVLVMNEVNIESDLSVILDWYGVVNGDVIHNTFSNCKEVK
jgi:hypothetical protein